MPRDKKGRLVFPRIIVRKPRQGDFHPMSRQMIARAYERLPLEYFYGLKEIELRARIGVVGRPFGKYSPQAKKIILYSIPAGPWHIMDPPRGQLNALRRYNARVENAEGGIVVEWPEDYLLFMFYLSVLFHELGHHYLEQYRCKKKPPLDKYLHEWHADAQVVKLQNYAFGKRID